MPSRKVNTQSRNILQRFRTCFLCDGLWKAYKRLRNQICPRKLANVSLRRMQGVKVKAQAAKVLLFSCLAKKHWPLSQGPLSHPVAKLHVPAKCWSGTRLFADWTVHHPKRKGHKRFLKSGVTWEVVPSSKRHGAVEPVCQIQPQATSIHHCLFWSSYIAIVEHP